MRVNLIKEKTVKDFVNVYPGSRIPFLEWMNKIKIIDWKAPAGILEVFSSADLLGNGTKRVVFNIGGNNYRMICHYAFRTSRVDLYICWIGTHAAYNSLCNKSKQYCIWEY